MPAISIVTVTLNRLEGLKQTLQSAAGQSFGDWELIVVDGASTDGTPEYLATLDDPRINWASEPDSGIYDAMNKGIALAKGDYVHILNSGDRYISGTVLESLMPVLRPDALNYGIVELPEGGRRKLAGTPPFRPWKMRFRAEIPHEGIVLSRKIYEEAGPFRTDMKIAADYDMTLRLLKQIPVNATGIRMVAMSGGGVSNTNFAQSAAEAREASMANGTNPLAAWAVFLCKKLNRLLRTIR